jgi:hypothetical protein
MSATIIRLADHRAVKPKIDPAIPHPETLPSLSGRLDVLAQHMAVIACGEGRKGGEHKLLSVCLWRLSEAVREMMEAAEKLERKYRKAKKRLKRR